MSLSTSNIRTSILLLVLILVSLNLRPALTSIMPVMERIVDDLSLSRAMASLVTTIPVLLMGLFAPITPILLRRWSLEFLLLGAMVLLSLAFVIRYFSQNSFTLLLISSFIAGVAIAVAGPLMSGFIKQYFVRKVNVAITIFSVSIAVGASLAVALTVPIANISGGWSHGLASWGLLSLFALVFMWAFLPKSAFRLTAKNNTSTSVDYNLPLHSHRAWLLTVFFAAQSGLFYALSTWLVAHFQHAGVDTIQASFFATVFMSSGILGSLVIPLLAATLTNVHRLIAGLSLLVSVLILLFAWMPNWYPLAVMPLLGICCSGIFSLALALPVLDSDSPQSSARLSSMMLSFGYVFSGLAPLVVGVGRDMTQSFAWPFTFLSLLGVLMVAIALYLPYVPAINSSAVDNR